MLNEIIRTFQLLLGVFVVLTVITNLNPRLPRFPWDILFTKFGLYLYIPVTTSLVVALVLAVFLRMFSGSGF